MKKILLVDAAEKVGCTVRDIMRLSMPSDDYSPSPYILWATLGDGWASHLDYMGNPMPNHKKMTIGACTTLLLPEQIHTILRRDSASLTAYYQDAESVSNRIDEYWALTPAQTVTSADVSISEDDLPKLLELLQSEKTLDLTPAASSPVSKPQAAPASEPVTSATVLTLPPAEVQVLRQQETVQITTHKIKHRTPSILDAEISEAKEKALNSSDKNSVWAELVKMAEQKKGCLLGMDGKEIKYQSGESVLFFKKRSLNERMNRAMTR